MFIEHLLSVDAVLGKEDREWTGLTWSFPFLEGKIDAKKSLHNGPVL